MTFTTRRVGAVTLLAAAVLAAVQTALLAHTMPPPDAIAYFEIADQIRAVGYARAMSQHWSPLYPVWLVVVRALTTTALGRELLVTAIADAVLLVALCGVAVFVLARLARLWHDDEASAAAWMAYGCGVTLLCAFAVLRVGLRVPDPLVAILAILVLWIWAEAIARGLPAAAGPAAGLVGGLAYLARSNLMHWSLAVALLAVTLAPGVSVGRRAVRFATFLAALLLVVALQTHAVSSATGRLSFGEGGKTVFAEIYGPVWPAGHPAWPVRVSDGDARIFADARMLNFPGFYDPSREYADAELHFTIAQAARGIGRAVLSVLFGYWAPSFALAWPMLWLTWPALLLAGGVRRPGVTDGPDVVVRRRVTMLLAGGGAIGLAIHLLSFAIGYYLPAYLIPLFAGVCLATLDAHRDGAVRRLAQRAAWIVAAGCVVMAALGTARYIRHSETRTRESAVERARALGAAVTGLPRESGRLSTVAVAGDWLGEYGLRLGRAQVLADIPDPAALRDPGRRAALFAALRARGIDTVLLSPDASERDDGSAALAGTTWRMFDLRAPHPELEP